MPLLNKAADIRRGGGQDGVFRFSSLEGRDGQSRSQEIRSPPLHQAGEIGCDRLLQNPAFLPSSKKACVRKPNSIYIQCVPTGVTVPEGTAV